MLRVSLLFLALTTACAVDVPDTFPVAITEFHTYVEGAGRWSRVVKREVKQDVVLWHKNAWKAVYGELTDVDLNDYARTGVISRTVNYVHYTL